MDPKIKILDTHPGRQYLALKILISIFSLLLFLAIIIPLFYENFASASFYTNLKFLYYGHTGSSYLNYPTTYNSGWSDSTAFLDIFYRYAYNLHERILYFIQTIFKTQNSATINQFGESIFALEVLVPFVAVFIVFFTSVCVVMFVKKRTNTWNFAAASINLFFVACFDAFLIALIISNQNMPITYGFKFNQTGVPYLMWIPVGLAAIVTALALWFFIVNFWLKKTLDRIYKPESLKYATSNQNLKRKIKETLNPRVPR